MGTVQCGRSKQHVLFSHERQHETHNILSTNKPLLGPPKPHRKIQNPQPAILCSLFPAVLIPVPLNPDHTCNSIILNWKSRSLSLSSSNSFSSSAELPPPPPPENMLSMAVAPLSLFLRSVAQYHEGKCACAWGGLVGTAAVVGSPPYLSPMK